MTIPKKGVRVTAEVKWIKITTDIFDNRKIKIIEKMPDGYAIIVAWVKLLCLAGMSTDCAEKLLGDVTFRPEKAYADLKEQCSCETCKYNDICEQGGDDIPICTDGNMWEWEGDDNV